MRRHLYPKNWEAISAEVRARANGQCECRGELAPNGCGLHRGRRCCEIEGTPAKWSRGTVRLTVHHKNFNKRDSRRSNLAAMCNRCHLRADMPLRAERRKLAEDQASGQQRFWKLSLEGKPEHAR